MILKRQAAPTKEYLATLDDAAFGAASEVTPKFVSPSDPAAQWTGAMRGPAFFAYADNYLIDVKFGIIMDVEASRAIRQAEVGAAKTMIERTEQRFDIKPERLAGDTAYGSAPTSTGSSTKRRSRRIFRSSTSRSARTAPSAGRTSHSTRSATFTSARPARFSRRLARCIDDETLLYRARTRDCRGCPLKTQCCPKAPFAQNPAQHLRGGPRCRSRTRQDRGIRAVTPRSQARRDAVCPPQAHPPARPSALARATRCPVRVHPGGDRAKPAPARQACRTTTAGRKSVLCIKGERSAAVGVRQSHARWRMVGA